MFEPARGHELHADANSKEGFAAGNHLLLQSFAHAGNGHETGMAILEGANTGQHNALGPAHLIGIRGNCNLPAAACRALEGFQGGMQIAGAIIDNCNLHGIQLFAPKRPSASKSLNAGKCVDGTSALSA